MGRLGTLVCAALPFGYGPAAKAIALAERLRRDWRLVFVGHGPALDLVSRSPGAFDHVVAGRATDAAAATAVAEAWGVLSVMDREAATAAARAGKPLFVVDSLLWMRAVTPEPMRAARAYWAQSFPGLVPEAHEPRPLVVGPIVSRSPRASGRPREGLVVNLGGSAAPDDRRALYAGYARFVARAVAEAGLLERFGSVTLLGGREAVSSATDAVPDARLRAEAAPHPEARRRMAAAVAVLTAPGLTATLESFEAGTPTWFLPPQNTSQWAILRRLRAAGVAEKSFHWEDLPGSPLVADRVRPEEADPAVLGAIARSVDDPGAAARLRGSLGSVGLDPEARASRQGSFFASLGPDGAEEIAASLARRAREAPGPDAATSP